MRQQFDYEETKIETTPTIIFASFLSSFNFKFWTWQR